MSPVQNMPVFGIWESCEYAKVTQCAKCSICNKYALIMLKILENACIYLNRRSLCKLMSSYRDGDVFRTLSKI